MGLRCRVVGWCCAGATVAVCRCRIPHSGDLRVRVFYFGMRGIIIKQLSTIHFQLSIHRSGLKKMYFFNCFCLKIRVCLVSGYKPMKEFVH